MADGGLAESHSERFSRLVYALVWWLATPVIAGYLLWRSRRQPAYRGGWAERFLGRYREGVGGPCLWVHAVSVGETRAAAPLVDGLRARYPGHAVLVTHMTPTGRDAAEALFGDTVRHAYLAYDYPHAVAAFLRHWRPRVGVVMETEIWPSMMAAAARAGTPMMLANGRLSPKSLVGARRWPSLMRPAARRFTRILAQTDADAKRFAILAEREHDAPPSVIATVGNVKFDVEPPPALHALAGVFRRWIDGHGDDAAQLADSRRVRVFLFASTRDGEEEPIFDSWVRHGAPAIAANGPRIVLVVVPRHPQRFDAVAGAARARGLVVQRRSEGRPLDDATQVWIGDSMGELWAYYLAADLAYVGGSVVPLGGQNLIEAAAAGCPVLLGRHTFNFTAASDEAVRVGAAVRVSDFDALIVAGVALAQDAPRRSRMADAGRSFAAAHRGATARTLAIVGELIDGAAAARDGDGS